MKVRTSFLLVAVMGLAVLNGLIHAGEDPVAKEALRADINKLMMLSGSNDLGMQLMDQLIGTFQKSNPEVPETFWQRVKAEINSDGITDLIVPVYEKYFSHEEIKQLIAFYETGIGKKLVASLPAIMQESITLGQEWGRQLGEKVIQQMREEGF